MPKRMFASIDAWIANQPEQPPSRTEAIRRLVDIALKSGGSDGRRKPTGASPPRKDLTVDDE
jgi:hypothetical protein